MLFIILFYIYRITQKDSEIKFVMQTLPNERLRRNVVRGKLDLVGKSTKHMFAISFQILIHNHLLENIWISVPQLTCVCTFQKKETYIDIHSTFHNDWSLRSIKNVDVLIHCIYSLTLTQAPNNSPNYFHDRQWLVISQLVMQIVHVFSILLSNIQLLNALF